MYFLQLNVSYINNMEAPLIFTAFANDRDAYLPLLNRERKNIHRTLRRQNDMGLIRLEQQASATVEDIFESLQHYKDSLSIFHYGGHAGGAQLMLETGDGTSQEAGALGIAKLLGTLDALQLVFLNGCATQAQVALLLQEGVPAVIATSVPIQDNMATEFAEQFYYALSSMVSIEKAFEIATAFIEAKYASSRQVASFRNLMGGDLETSAEELPWGLYVGQGKDEHTAWHFPNSLKSNINIRNRFDYETRIDVNDLLIDTICESLAEYNEDLNYELGKENLDIPSIKREIIDCFPTPIGEQMRKLFTRSNDPDQPDQMEAFTEVRLKQLILVYRTTVQFVGFILLSQLWDERHRNPNLEIGEDHIVDFNSFFSLTKDNYKAFDYVKFIRTITDIFDANNIKYFIDELEQMKADIEGDKELFAAYLFLNNVYYELQSGLLATDQIENICLEAEERLGKILRSVAFLVKYKMATIKNIELIKNRHETARYRHNKIMLNKALTVASTGIAEVGVVFNNFTDNQCVLFFKTQTKDDTVNYLSLSPFIIDENAINKEYSSKLYIYTYQGDEGYYYQFLNNVKDEKLHANNTNYPKLYEEFEKFKADIFGSTYVPRLSPVAPTSGKTSRFLKNR